MASPNTITTETLPELYKSILEQAPKKTCCRCKVERSVFEFHRCQKRLRSECKWCRPKEPYKGPYGKVRVYDQRRRVQCLLKYAVKVGRIVKTDHCEMCHGLFIERRLQGHHFKGYEFPLEVKWLCYRCHKAIHSMEKRIVQ